MKFGVNLINFGPIAEPGMLRRWVKVADGLGYHFVMTSDHIAVTPDVAARYPAPLYEPVSTMGWLAGITDRMMIGTTVIIVPYRSPLETARAFANLDRLSGGRVILGVGIGWAEREFAALGVPFNRRGAITDEYLEVIRRHWTEDVISFEGEFVSFDGVDTAPRPLQDPHPPIWVGGASDAALRRTVRHGDAWHPIRIRADTFRDQEVPRLARAAEAEGKPVPGIAPRVRLRVMESDLPEEGRLAGTGSMEQIRRDLAMLQEIGCEYVLLDTFYDDIDGSRNYPEAWRMLSAVAEEAIDLAGGTLR